MVFIVPVYTEWGEELTHITTIPEARITPSVSA